MVPQKEACTKRRHARSSEEDVEVATEPHTHGLVEPPRLEEASVMRELNITRVSLIIEALGILALWKSRNAFEVNIGDILIFHDKGGKY